MTPAPDEPRPETLTHVGPDGRARMVDVSAKPATERVARASGAIVMSRDALDAVRANALGKGDVLGVARVAGVMGGKRTAELVPLCHPVPLTDLQVDLALDEALPGVRAEATARTVAPTGVEMEAIVAVTTALVTVYDMVKAVDRAMRITEVRLEEKRGGRSGHWQRNDRPGPPPERP
jgi:cyclic pyranopterin monophosphate synthase